MRIGVSTACFYPQPVEEVVPLLTGLGVRAIEVFVNTESEFSSAFARQLSSIANSCGVDIVSVHPYTSLMEGMMLLSDYPRRTEDGMAQYQRYFEFTASVGARFFTFHGERNLGGVDDPARAERKLKTYRRLCSLAGSCGVTLAQENVAWCKSENPAYLRWLYDNVPELRYTLDIKQAGRAGRYWRDFVDVVGDRIVNVHINDYSAAHSCLLPGEGDMDYDDFFHRMHALGYQGQALIEVYRSNFGAPEDMSRALRVLGRYAPI